MSRFFNKIRNELTTDSQLKELKIEREQWDRFLILDAEYYLPILTNNLYLSFEEEILTAYFVVYSVRHDLISYWDLSQNELMNEFYGFCKAYNCYLDNKTIFEYFEFLKTTGSNYSREEIESLLENLLDKFYQTMKEEGKMREYKKDYFV